MAEHATHAPAPNGEGHETRDVRVRPILAAAAGLIVVALFIHVAMWGLLDVLAVRESRESAPVSPLAGAYGMKAPPEPRLQTHPIADLETLHRAEDAILHSYGWVDRGAGVVRLPIERAMDLVAAASAAAPPAAGAVELERVPSESGFTIVDPAAARLPRPPMSAWMGREEDRRRGTGVPEDAAHPSGSHGGGGH